MTRFGSPMAMTVAEEGSEDETQQVRPKSRLWILLGKKPAGELDVALRGFSQLVWFSTLKNSARNCSLKRSVMPKSFKRPESKFQKFGPCTMLRPLPFCPGGGMQKNVCVPMTLTQLKFGSLTLVIRLVALYITGPANVTPLGNCKLPLSRGPRTWAKLTCAPLVVSEPLVMLSGSPLWYAKMPVMDQPPMMWFTQLGALPANLLPLPMGISYSRLASSTWVLLKSESARSSR